MEKYDGNEEEPEESSSDEKEEVDLNELRDRNIRRNENFLRSIGLLKSPAEEQSSRKRKISNQDQSTSTSDQVSRPTRKKFHKASFAEELKVLVCTFCSYKTHKRPLSEAKELLDKHQAEDQSCQDVRSKDRIVERSNASK